MKTKIVTIGMIAIGLLNACSDSFLDAKPSSNIIIPNKIEDYISLLDNTNSLNFTAGLGQLAADDYVYVSDQMWASKSATERNAYIWAKDIFEGELKKEDWNAPYVSVFYANNVLDGIEKIKSETNPAEFNNVKGWALFTRGFAFYDLLRTFAKSYNPATANADLGVPIRLNANIDEILPRASVQQSYDQVIKDLEGASKLLSPQFPQIYRNRPSRVAAYAMLSRVYLSMNNFDKAEKYADTALSMYNKLIDYNTVSLTSVTPFSETNDETLFSTSQIIAYSVTNTIVSNTAVTVNPELISLYNVNDLRLGIFFAKNSQGNYYVKRGYYGTGNYPFTGLATNELYLIRAECLARKGNVTEGMVVLNELLKNRYKKTPAFVPISAADAEDAIAKILLERRKELVWRGIRWSDIKRLNVLGAGITLKRAVNGIEYTLAANDDRYAMPIPDDEISRSNLVQNPR